MTIHHGDCVEVMGGMDPESVDAIVCDPPYGLEFMGKEWDRLDGVGKSSAPSIAERDESNVYGRTGRISYNRSNNRRCRTCGHWEWSGTPCTCDRPDFPSPGKAMQEWHARWAEAAYRVAKPSAYLLAFGGTRTVHRMTVALEDAGWIIRDMLVWAYASGFPKSKASLKPAWEPIVMARKPGPLRMLAIDECRIGIGEDERDVIDARSGAGFGTGNTVGAHQGRAEGRFTSHAAGRWPANVVLTDPIFDGGVEGVVGGGESLPKSGGEGSPDGNAFGDIGWSRDRLYGDSGTYSRFFLIPKAARADREPVLGGLERPVDARMGLVHGGPGEPGKGSKEAYGYHPKPRANVHPTVKPTELMRHLVRLVTPAGGVVLDPFLGSGTTAIAAEQEGFQWIGIEREAEYVAIAEARLNGTQKGLGLAG